MIIIAIILNVIALCFNVLVFVGVFRYYETKRDKLKEISEKLHESLSPQLFRHHLQKQECCVICKGNTPRKPGGYPKQISVHQLCLNRFNAEEIELKLVGEVKSEHQINLKKELQLSLQNNNLILIGDYNE